MAEAGTEQGTAGTDRNRLGGLGFAKYTQNDHEHRCYTAAQANQTAQDDPSQFCTAPVFRRSPSFLQDSSLSDNQIRQFLAKGIPALSGPAGSRAVVGQRLLAGDKRTMESRRPSIRPSLALFSPPRPPRLRVISSNPTRAEARKQEGRAEGEGTAAVFALHARLLPP